MGKRLRDTYLSGILLAVALLFAISVLSLYAEQSGIASPTALAGFEESSFEVATIASNCAVINVSASLDTNILTNTTSNCIHINASNLVFNCSGFSIGGNTTGVGINATDVVNVTIKDCRVENFSNNVRFSNTNNSWITNVTAYNSSDDSLAFVSGSNNNTIANSTFVAAPLGAADGASISGSVNNTFWHSNFTSGATGSGLLILSSSHNSTLINVTGGTETSAGIDISGSHNTTLINVTGVASRNGIGIKIDNSNSNVVLNSTGTSNTSSGVSIGDTLGAAFNIVRDVIGISGTSRGVLFASVATDNTVGNVTGQSNGSSGSGIEDSGGTRNTFVNITGRSISGTGLSLGGAAIVRNSQGNSSTGVGILVSSSTINLSHSTGTSNGSNGVQLSSASNNVLNNVTGISTSGNGIRISFGQDNFVENSTAISNSSNGLLITESSYNTYRASRAMSNFSGGLAITGDSNYNNITDSVFSNSTVGIFIAGSGHNASIVNSKLEHNQRGINLTMTAARIENTTLSNMTRVGIHVYGGGVMSFIKNITCANCTIGMQVGGNATNTTLTFSTFRNGSIGLFLTGQAIDTLLENTTLAEQQRTGVLINETARQNTLRNLTFEQNLWGVTLAGGSANLIVNMTINGTRGSLNVTGNGTRAGFNNSINQSLVVANSTFEFQDHMKGPAILTYVLNITFSTQRLFQDVIRVGYNSIFVNATAASELNTSARITLFNLFFQPNALVDTADSGTYANCSASCTEISVAPGRIAFNVSAFSNYSSNETNLLTNNCINVSSEANATYNGTLVNSTNTTGSDGAGYSIASADVNNDNVTDLIIGAPFSEANRTISKAGKVYVVFGASPFPASGNLSSIANITISGNYSEALVGRAVASGDINNDSIADIIVGAPGNDTVGIFFGATGLANQALSLIQANVTINLTGIDDLGLAIGDINNDSVKDIIIGQPDHALDGNFQGRVDVLFGRPTWPGQVNLSQNANATFNGTSPEEYFGFSVVTGDVNNDSVEDLVMSAPGRNITSVTHVGEGYVFFGRNTFGTAALSAANITFQGEPNIAGLNNSFALTGFSLYARADVNNDSTNDMLIGSPRSIAPPDRRDAGAVYIVFGASSLSGTVNLSNANVTLYGVFGNSEGIPPGERAGFSVFAKDITADRIPDIFVGAPFAPARAVYDAGIVYEVYGRNSWARFINLTNTSNRTICGSRERGFLGFALSNGSSMKTSQHEAESITESSGGTSTLFDIAAFASQPYAGEGPSEVDYEEALATVGGGGTGGSGGDSGGGGGGGGSSGSGCCVLPDGRKGVRDSYAAGHLLGPGGIRYTGYCAPCDAQGWPELLQEHGALASKYKNCCGNYCETMARRGHRCLTIPSYPRGYPGTPQQFDQNQKEYESKCCVGCPSPTITCKTEEHVVADVEGMPGVAFKRNYLELVSYFGIDCPQKTEKITCGESAQDTYDMLAAARDRVDPQREYDLSDERLHTEHESCCYPSCGDGKTDKPVEDCDGKGSACTVPANKAGAGMPGTCDGLCQCKPLCGNAALDPGEECDPAINQGKCTTPDQKPGKCITTDSRTRNPCTCARDYWDCPVKIQLFVPKPVPTHHIIQSDGSEILQEFSCTTQGMLDALAAGATPADIDPPNCCPCPLKAVQLFKAGKNACIKADGTANTQQKDPSGKLATNPCCKKNTCQPDTYCNCCAPDGKFVQGTLASGMVNVAVGGIVGVVNCAPGAACRRSFTTQRSDVFCVKNAYQCDITYTNPPAGEPPYVRDISDRAYASILWSPSKGPCATQKDCETKGGEPCPLVFAFLGMCPGQGPPVAPPIVGCVGCDITTTDGPEPGITTEPGQGITVTQSPTTEGITDVTTINIITQNIGPEGPTEVTTFTPSPLITPTIAPPTPPAPLVQVPPELQQEIPCVTGSPGSSISTADDRARLPAGYKKIVSFRCEGSGIQAGVTLDDRWSEVRTWRVRDGSMSEVPSSPTAESSCGGVSTSDIRSAEIAAAAPSEVPVEEITQLTEVERVVLPPDTDRTLSTPPYTVELLNAPTQPTKVGFSNAKEAVPAAENPSLRIFGTPFWLSINPNYVGPVKITGKIAVPQFIDASSVGLYARFGTTWRAIPTTLNPDGTFTASIEDISLYLVDGKVLLAWMGVYCATCPDVKLEQVYPGSSRNAIVLVHGLTTDSVRWQALIDDFVRVQSPFQIWTLSYPLAYKSDEVARQFASQLETHASEFDSIYLVTHSIGGIEAQLATKYAKDSNYAVASKIRKTIMAGQPGLGSPSADVYRKLFAVLVNIKSTAMVLGQNSPLLQEAAEGRQIERNPETEYFIVAGRRSYPFTKDLFTTPEGVYQPNDGILTTVSARTVGGTEIIDKCEHYYEVPLTHTELSDALISMLVIERIINKDMAGQNPDGLTPGYVQHLRIAAGACAPGDVIVVGGKEVTEGAEYDPTLCSCGNGVCGLGEDGDNCPEDCKRVLPFAYLCKIMPLFVYPLLLILLIASSSYAYRAIRKHQRGKGVWGLLALTAALAATLGLMHAICGKAPALGYILAAFTLAILLSTLLHLGRESGGYKPPKYEPPRQSTSSIIDARDIKELERLLEETKKYEKR